MDSATSMKKVVIKAFGKMKPKPKEDDRVYRMDGHIDLPNSDRVHDQKHRWQRIIVGVSRSKKKNKYHPTGANTGLKDSSSTVSTASTSSIATTTLFKNGWVGDFDGDECKGMNNNHVIVNPVALDADHRLQNQNSNSTSTSCNVTDCLVAFQSMSCQKEHSVNSFSGDVIPSTETEDHRYPLNYDE